MRLLLALATGVLALSIVAPAPGAVLEGAYGGTASVLKREARSERALPLALSWPAKGTLTSHYGPRYGRQHRGIDIGILRSLRLDAAADGVVRQAGYLGGYEGYGMVVVLDVGRGVKLLYAHLSRVDVRPGQRVKRGKRIGLAGCTGSCTGTHLHFEVHKRGRAVNPLPLLRRYNRSL